MLEPTLDDPFGFGNGVQAPPTWVCSFSINEVLLIESRTKESHSAPSVVALARLVGRRRMRPPRTPHTASATSRASAAEEASLTQRADSSSTGADPAAKLALRLETRSRRSPRGYDSGRQSPVSPVARRVRTKGSFQPRGRN